MKFYKTFATLLAVGLIAISLNSCSKNETGPIKIGVLLPLTGHQANF